MSAKRENTLVVDLCVLPKRPDAPDVEKFINGELKLNMAHVKNIQFHNVRNVVFIEMIDETTALLYHNNHHLRRKMKIDGKEYKIPVYVDDDAVNVRVHDLPPQTANTALKEHMKHFGTILSISREVWKNYFPGVPNGVRVVRMRLTKPIPSYQTIDGETTLVTYRNQTKTCRYCERKAHPGQKCSYGSNTAEGKGNHTDSVPFTTTDFPALTEQQNHQKQQQQKQSSHSADRNNGIIQQSNENNSDVDSIASGTADVQTDDSDSNSDELLTNNKRRLSTIPDGNEKNEMKRKNMTSNSTQSDESAQQDLQSQDYREHDENMAPQMKEYERESSNTVSPVSPAVTRSQKKKKQMLQNI